MDCARKSFKKVDGTGKSTVVSLMSGLRVTFALPTRKPWMPFSNCSDVLAQELTLSSD
jgi:hypothetical protein